MRGRLLQWAVATAPRAATQSMQSIHLGRAGRGGMVIVLSFALNRSMTVAKFAFQRLEVYGVAKAVTQLTIDHRTALGRTCRAVWPNGWRRR